jgi:WD40 repeat protein
MDHPAIAKVFDAGSTAEGRPYFVMEYVPGMPITEYCDRHKLTLRERLELFARVCEGVQHAHQKAIIHRDLKPSNILVSEVDGKPLPKIIDFGVAKATAQRLTAGTMLTRLGTVIGTLEYMSPEQADSAGEDIDTRADVYSLGVILYELLVGARPLDYGKLALGDVLRRIREEDAPRPSTRVRTAMAESAAVARNRRTEPAMLTRQLRGDLDAITLKALEKDRARRYGSPSELGADLQRYLRDEPVSAGPATVMYRARKFVSKHRWWIAAAVAFVAMLVAGVAVSTWEAVRANRERDRAVTATHEANAQKFAAFASASMAEDPERSIVLAMHAVNATMAFGQGSLPAAETVLHAALMASRVRLTLHGHRDSVDRVAFSPDGTTIATASWDGTAKLWNSATGRELQTLPADPGRVVRAVGFSPDGKRVVTGGSGKVAKVWDAATGRELGSFAGHAAPIMDAAFHPDGKRIATASEDGTVKLWYAEGGREWLTLNAKGGVGCVVFSPDGARLLTCGSNSVTIWSAATGREVGVLVGHQGLVMRAAYSPDGRRIATGGFDTTSRVWDAASGRELVTFRGHKQPVRWVTFSPDGKRVASSGVDATVRLWNAANGQELLMLRTGLAGAACLAFSPDGARLAGAVNDVATLWDVSKQEEVIAVRGSAVAFSRDGSRLASGGRDSTATVWDVPGGHELQRLRGHEAMVTNLSYNRDGTRLATASDDGTARVWDAGSGHEMVTLRGHGSGLTCVTFSEDGLRLATSGLDRTVRVWDAGSGRELKTLRGLEDHVACVAFSPDGSRVVAASADKRVIVWDATDGRVLLTWRAEKFSGYLATVALSPDGSRVAAAGGNTVSIWEAPTGKEVRTFPAGRTRVTMVRFSPDSRKLAVGTADGGASVFDAGSGSGVLTLQGEQPWTTGVAFSADGRRLATADRDGIVQVYALAAKDLMEIARVRVTRALSRSECRTYFGTETCPKLP